MEKLNNIDKKALEWVGHQLGYDIWNNKYRFNEESFDEWVERLSNGVHGLKELIINKKFLYGGRILANLNTGTSQGVSNCVTLGYVEDSLEDIMDTAKNLAFSYKKEAGVGICLSKIRPKGAKIGEKGVSDGIIGFLKIFNEVTANISRGNQRRGAMLVGLHCDHPDIKDFITIKKDNKGSDGLITSANISVLVTDEFMLNYKSNSTYRKDFIVESTGEVIEHIVNPKEIIELIADTPKTSFEPGILFVDRYQENHLFGYTEGGKWMFNNACSEFIGEKGTVCLLGSMNLSEFVKEELGTTWFDFEDFKKSVEIAITALDKAHDYGIGRNGLDLQNQRAEDYRGLGLGIMGLADMFMKLGIVYGSDESIRVSDKIAKLMKEISVSTSIHLAEKFGQPKGIIKDEKYLIDNNLPVTRGLRNNSLLSIAPAGSIGTMLGVSTGIEPVFRTSYMRKTQSLHSEDTYYEVLHKPIQDIVDRLGYKPKYCIDTRDVNPRDKVNMIAVWQKYVDLSISNTTNFGGDTDIEDIRDLYVYGWEKGVKGLTVYVDGSIEGVLNDKKDSTEPEITEELKRGEIAKVPNDLISKRVIINHGCGSYTLHIYKCSHTGEIFDCFINSKSQGCQSNVQTIAVTLSLLLRAGVSLDRIEKALNGTGACPSFMVGKVQGRCSNGKSCGTAILQAIKDFKNTNSKVTIEVSKEDKQQMIKELEHLNNITDKNKCPECGEPLQHTGGCIQCNCGYSKCS
ncbi:MAG: hypothetical protein ACRDBY_04925 [Cetobacterium sp.]